MRLKPSHIVLPVAGLAAIALLSHRKASLKYHISGISVQFEGVTPILRVALSVENATNTAAQIHSISSILYSGDQEIGRSLYSGIVMVPGKSVTDVSLLFRLNPLAVVSDILVLIQRGSGISKTLRLKGYVRWDNNISEIDLSYKIA